MTDITDTPSAVSQGNRRLPETAKLTGEAHQPQSTTWQITGIDVSRWQREIDWQQALTQGLSFSFLKATEGTQVIDSQFERNMHETARLGIPSSAA